MEADYIREVGRTNLKWSTKKPTTPYGCTVWRGICNRSNIFQDRIRYNVKKGTTIKFWEEAWLFEKPIALLCPNLYSSTRSQNSLVSEIGSMVDERANWNLNLSRRIDGDTIDGFAFLMNALDSLVLDLEEDDEYFWKESKSKVFTVASCYDNLTKQVVPPRRWEQRDMNPRSKEVWNLLPAAITRSIWLERNGRVFENKETPVDKVIISIKELVFYWISASKNFENCWNPTKGKS
ncbi:hypothetical protein BVC80_1157g5 [Macleaya cordata]|uniref:Reverse transcriptase zinc-binding domain n=1 Tax=Macleaya cordata TaxID=56857 RepID=A0A200QR70_MACCD|nr:hypothetical protein BVC80_1157g5 [Macleaya cordata]